MPRPVGDLDLDELRESPERFINRELSWLDFDARVLALAADRHQPLLERAKFLAIFSQNLDEFFQVRVAGLKDQVAAGLGKTTPDGRSAATQLAEIRERLAGLSAMAEAIFADEIVPALAETGIVFSGFDDLDEDDRKYLDEVFEERIFPVLTPLAVDPGHPFPYISDLSLNLAVVVHDPVSGDRRFARVKVPNLLPRFVVMPDGERFVPLEQVIASPPRRAVPGHGARVCTTPSGSPATPTSPSRRRRPTTCWRRSSSSCGVGASVGRSASRSMPMSPRRSSTCSPGSSTWRPTTSTTATSRSTSAACGRCTGSTVPDLKDEPWVPITQPRLTSPELDEPVDLFSVIRDGDVLVHHPYESFSSSAEEFIRQASRDPQVLAIKLTLYRTSSDTSIIKSLVRAAESGQAGRRAGGAQGPLRREEEHRVGRASWRRRASTSSTGSWA